MSSPIIVDEWRNLYSESWKGVIADEAFAHPAKFSRALIRKIYDHVIAGGWATKGSCVIDPFGGVALGGFDAMRHGLNFVGVELEQKFVELGAQNIALWNERFSRMPNWGSARLIQGDSRKLAEVLSAAECCVSSPPYVDAVNSKSNGIDWNKAGRPDRTKPSENRISPGVDAGLIYGSSEGQLGAIKEGDHSIVVSSPPYAQSVHDGNGIDRSKLTGNRAGKNTQAAAEGYGKTEGQLGAMPECQLRVTSPPFESSLSSGKLSDTQLREMAQRGHKPSASGQSADYGSTAGNLGNMRSGFEATISSPPYEAQFSRDAGGNHDETFPSIGTGGAIHPRVYSQDVDNLGNQRGEHSGLHRALFSNNCIKSWLLMLTRSLWSSRSSETSRSLTSPRSGHNSARRLDSGSYTIITHY